MTTPDKTPNRDQSALWNAASGPVWVTLNPILDRTMAPFAERVVEEAFPGEGKRVLDIGCGGGATTLAMAKKLGARGVCVGVDISEPLLDLAKKRAEAAGASAELLLADAQTHAFTPASFDAVISRFGVMFFDAPEAAFANIRTAMRPSAKLAFVAWRTPAENPFMITPAVAAAPLLPDLAQYNPDAPGPFAFSDRARIESILGKSGWKDVSVAPFDVPTQVPEADLHEYITKIGPVGRAFGKADAPTQKKVAQVVREALDPFMKDGAAHFTASVWLVTARNA